MFHTIALETSHDSVRSVGACALGGADVASLTSQAMAAGKTITAVMHSDLRVIDPLFTTPPTSRAIMATWSTTRCSRRIPVSRSSRRWRTWKVCDDKLTYTFTLRDGLKWHDGTPVTAEDCVASLKRWGKRDGMGQKLMDFTASMEADRRQDHRAETEGALRPGAGFDRQAVVASAVHDAEAAGGNAGGQPIKEQIGSGPFKFVQAEFQPGVKAVYEKNKDYVPRKEPPSWTSGGKVVKVDRVEWITMPDAQTAVNALQSGDIDFMENPSFDLLPVLEAQQGHQDRDVSNKLGFQTLGRMNFLHPPFDNVKVRRAALLAMNQKDVLDALVGNPKYHKICGAFFVCGTPLATDVGAETLIKGSGMAEAKKALAESGYDGTPIVIMAPGDVVTLKAQPVVAAQLLRDAGFKVDLQATDWQTVVTRRASQKPPKEGGWNMFFTNWVGADVVNPDRQRLDRRPRQERRLVRLGGKRQDRGAAGQVCALLLAGGAEEDCRRDPEGSLRPGDLRSARPVPGAERVAEVAHRRSRWPGNADLLEHRQERVGRSGRPTIQASRNRDGGSVPPSRFYFGGRNQQWLSRRSSRPSFDKGEGICGCCGGGG